MTLIHDIIKIKYVNLGYIKKNYPYHLISDKEMFSAFICLDSVAEFDASKSYSKGDRVTYQDHIYVCRTDIPAGEFNDRDWVYCEYFFDDNYPNPFAETDYMYKGNTSLSDEYKKLKAYIISTINDYLTYYGTSEESEHLIPDWIYTYMLGEVVYQNSEYLDIYDTLNLLGLVNTDNDFTPEACAACYVISLQYISTLTTGVRPPTVFGEPHIIKQLRLEA